MLKTSHGMVVHLSDLYYEIKLDIGTLTKERGGSFQNAALDVFMGKFLHYVNEVIFEMVETSQKDKYLGRTTPTSLKNEVSTCRIM